jgi:hypothetical protein
MKGVGLYWKQGLYQNDAGCSRMGRKSRLFVILCFLLLMGGLSPYVLPDKAYAADTLAEFKVLDDPINNYPLKTIGLSNGKMGFFHRNVDTNKNGFKVLNADGQQAFDIALPNGEGIELYPLNKGNGETFLIYVEDFDIGNTYGVMKALTIGSAGQLSAATTLAASKYMGYPNGAAHLSNGGAAIYYRNEDASAYLVSFYNSSLQHVKTLSFNDSFYWWEKRSLLVSNNNDRVLVVHGVSNGASYKAELFDNSGNLIKGEVFSGSNIEAISLSNGNFAIYTGGPLAGELRIYDTSGNLVGDPVSVEGLLPTNDNLSIPDPMLLSRPTGGFALYDFDGVNYIGKVKLFNQAAEAVSDWIQVDDKATSMYGYTPFVGADGKIGFYNDLNGHIVFKSYVANSTSSPTVSGFDKYSGAPGYKDVSVTLELNGNTLGDIKRNGVSIGASNYSANAATVTIKKEYLATLAAGAHVFTFEMNAGTDPTLTVTISDSTPVPAPLLTLTSSDVTGAGSDGKTKITVAETAASPNKLVYKNFGVGSVSVPYLGDTLTGYIDLPGDGVITASNGDKIAVAEVDAAGKVARFGQTTAVVINASVMSGTVTIDGTAKYGETLTANLENVVYMPITNEDIPTYQWKRGGAAIFGATGESYTLTQADIGMVITVTVTADGVHAVGNMTSAGTLTVAKADGPGVPDVPALSGKSSTSITLTGAAGQQYSIDNGATWGDSFSFNGLTPNTEYIILTRIKGTATHEPSEASSIRVTTNEAPIITGQPLDTTAKEGDNVSFSVAAEGTGITYQWEENTGAGFTGIAGQIGPTFNLFSVDVGMNGYQYRVIVTDSGGLVVTSNEATLTVNNLPTASSVSIRSSNATPGKAKVGDTVTLDVVTSEAVTEPTVTIAGNPATVQQGADAQTWTATHTLQASDAEGTVEITLDFANLLGYQAVQVTATTDGSSVQLDMTPPIASAVTMSSSNTVPGKAKAGDTITLSISTSEEVQTVTAMIAGNPATVQQGADAKTWTATYILQASDAEGAIGITLDFADLVGNQAVQVTAATDGSEVALDTTLPVASAVTISTSNAAQGKAKAGDTITLSMFTSEEVKSVTATITGRPATVVQGADAQTWTATYTLQASDVEGTIGFTLGFADLAGNQGVQVTAATDGSEVVLDKTLPVASTVTTSTSNAAHGKAKAGDTITLSMSMSEEVQAVTASIAGRPATVVQGADAKTWTATYTLQASDAEGTVPFTLDFADLAGNQAVQVTATTDGSGVDMDKTWPVASAVAIRSSNVISGIAKVGDTITLSISTSEEVQNVAAMIAGNPATVVQGSDAQSWTAMYILQANDAEGEVGFTLDFADLVGNPAVQVRGTTDSSSVIYDRTAPAKPTISAEPVGKTNQHVTITILYPADAVSNLYKVQDEAWKSYTAPFDVESNAMVYAKAIDGAGNESAIADFEIRNIDKVKPAMTLIGEAELRHEAGTPYLDAGATALDDEDGNLTDRITVTGAVYSDQLGIYVLGYHVTDQSGNAAEEITRTVHVVDTTPPVMTLIGDPSILVPIGGTFIDLGATAIDHYDGDISNQITVTGNVYTQLLGRYTLTYLATDSSGNEGKAVRTVTVYDHEQPVILLAGDVDILHEVGNSFHEPGFTAWDNQDGDLTNAVTITGSVNHNQLGTYTLEYDVVDSAGNGAAQAIRIVKVVDTQKPVLSLLGDSSLAISQGSVFIDPGAAAEDNYDGDLTSRIAVTGTVNTVHPGVYTLIYKVRDSSGNEATAERILRVLSMDASLKLLSVNQGALTPAFSPGVRAYTVYVANHVNQISVSLQTNEAHAKIKVNNQAEVLDSTGSARVELSLNVGRNEMSIEATAQDGTITTYTIIFTREDEESETPTPPPSTPKQEPANTGVNVLVNGKVENAGRAAREEVNGQEVLTISVDEVQLRNRLEAEGTQSVITIPVTAKSDVVIGELNGRMVKNMEDKQATVKIQTENATYTLPAQQINIDAISERFGTSLALQDIKVKIEIAALPVEAVRVVEDAVQREGLTLIVPPLNFKVSATYKDRTEEISRFNAYVERIVAIPAGIDPSRITTGVVVEPDGTVRHVPTKIIMIDGAYYAQINSLTNSIYSVIWNPAEFEDAANHWAKDAINNMGSRMVLQGTGTRTFSPDLDITRAEFAAIIARGLGLRLESGDSIFADVKRSDWYYSVIQTAYSYQLIHGFEDGTFRPNERITREQAMVIVSKAMAITKLRGAGSERGAADNLRAFVDARSVSGWAVEGVADSVTGGIITGRDHGELAPQDFITRAEVAAIMQRLLQKSDLINQ